MIPFSLSFALLLVASLAVPRSSFVDISQDTSKFPAYSYLPDPVATRAWFDVFANETEIPLPFRNPQFYAGRWSGNSFGHVGVAIFDFDGDGDADIYVPNSEGTANSLFKNLLKETGVMKFVDVANQYGVDAPDLDSQGVCVADVDNDGDLDFVVLSIRNKPRLFINKGPNQPFEMHNSFFKTSLDTSSYASCSFGDVNGDGFHDLFIGSSASTQQFQACHDPNVWPDLKNELWINDGTGQNFVDEAAQRGLLANGSSITWAVVAVDIDQDGDMDLLEANDICTVSNGRPIWGDALVDASLEQATIRVWVNDGSGHFVERSRAYGTNKIQPEQWMGIDVGDLNNDGLLDIFGANFGDSPHFSTFQFPVVGRTRHFLQKPDGTFDDAWPAFPDPIGTEFGFGISLADFDASGTTDVVYFGGADGFRFIFTSNPGVLLRNDGQANFEFDDGLAKTGKDFQSECIKGTAVGDLNLDGYPDIVTIGDMVIPPFTGPIQPNGLPEFGLPRTAPGSYNNTPGAENIKLNPFQYSPVLGFSSFTTTRFDPVTFQLFFAQFPDLFDPNTGLLNRKRIDYGKLHVEINQNGVGSSNRWVGLSTVGTVSGTPKDGIGSTIRVWGCDPKKTNPKKDKDCLEKCTRFEGTSQMIPILGGSSSASTDWFVKTFGLGSRDCADIEVFWSSTRKTNSFVSLSGKFGTLPQIDCDVKSASLTKVQFQMCVQGELNRLVGSGYLNANEKVVVRKSMLNGFARYHAAGAAGSVSGHLSRESTERIAFGVCGGLVGSALVCGLCIFIRRRCALTKTSVSNLAADMEVGVELEDSVGESPNSPEAESVGENL